jgi:hypothetical protein
MTVMMNDYDEYDYDEYDNDDDNDCCDNDDDNYPTTMTIMATMTTKEKRQISKVAITSSKERRQWRS